jgi:2-hydroxy-3-oxopropionate reductase
MADQSSTIGFIGLGIMGRPIAENLIRAGYKIVVHTRTPSRAETVIAAGATWADSPAATAAASEVVITMLPDSPDVIQVIRGTDGMLAGARPLTTWIDMSTIAPLVTRELAAEAAEVHVGALDAPVSGGEKGAIEATLSIMVGGPSELLERHLPLLGSLGSSIVHIGEESGSGQLAKACNQLVVGGTIAIVAEAITLASRAGVDPNRVREALMGGLAQSRVLDTHAQRMLERSFAPGFRIRLHQKDLGIALDTGRASHTAMPVTALVSQLMQVAAAAGNAELDHSALVTAYEQLTANRLEPGPSS